MTPDLDLDAAIRTVVETIDAEGTQGKLDRLADDLQQDARCAWLPPYVQWRAHWHKRQRRAARKYEAARDAFMRAYRFEKAMEVLRGR